MNEEYLSKAKTEEGDWITGYLDDFQLPIGIDV